MSEEKQVKWVCTRCGRRNDIELEADPVAYEVCDLCKVENHCRLIKAVVVVPPVGEDADTHTTDNETVIEELEELPALDIPEEKEDPYQEMTKEQLVELLKEKE